jgi:hypothetical protein
MFWRVLLVQLEELGQRAGVSNEPRVRGILQVKKSFVPDYYDVIKNPRDLGTVKKNLIRKKYETPQEFYEVLGRIGSHHPSALLHTTGVVHCYHALPAAKHVAIAHCCQTTA